MMTSFVSLFSIMIAVMVAGKYYRGKRGSTAVLVIAAALQTAVTFYEFYTMQVPQP